MHQTYHEDDILTVKEVSLYLKLSRSQTYYLLQRGVIPHFKIGKLKRVRYKELIKWLEEKMEYKQ